MNLQIIPSVTQSIMDMNYDALWNVSESFKWAEANEYLNELKTLQTRILRLSMSGQHGKDKTVLEGPYVTRKGIFCYKQHTFNLDDAGKLLIIVRYEGEALEILDGEWVVPPLQDYSKLLELRYGLSKDKDAAIMMGYSDVDYCRTAFQMIDKTILTKYPDADLQGEVFDFVEDYLT